MRKWTLEERLAQSKLIRLQRPWESSTGPKTPDGKAISQKNSYKHGARRLEVRELSCQLTQLKKMLSNIMDFI